MSAYCEIERPVQSRLIQHLQRRSQRPYQPPQGESWLRHLARLGLIRLSDGSSFYFWALFRSHLHDLHGLIAIDRALCA